jgi:hypothetical protein
LVERLVRNEKVSGSNPLCSTPSCLERGVMIESLFFSEAIKDDSREHS